MAAFHGMGSYGFCFQFRISCCVASLLHAIYYTYLCCWLGSCWHGREDQSQWIPSEMSHQAPWRNLCQLWPQCKFDVYISYYTWITILLCYYYYFRSELGGYTCAWLTILLYCFRSGTVMVRWSSFSMEKMAWILARPDFSPRSSSHSLLATMR